MFVSLSAILVHKRRPTEQGLVVAVVMGELLEASRRGGGGGSKMPGALARSLDPGSATGTTSREELGKTPEDQLPGR